MHAFRVRTASNAPACRQVRNACDGVVTACDEVEKLAVLMQNDIRCASCACACVSVCSTG